MQLTQQSRVSTSWCIWIDNSWQQLFRGDGIQIIFPVSLYYTKAAGPAAVSQLLAGLSGVESVPRQPVPARVKDREYVCVTLGQVDPGMRLLGLLLGLLLPHCSVLPSQARFIVE